MPGTLVPDAAIRTGDPRLARKRTRQIRVDEDVANMADRLASLQDPPQSTPEFLTELLRPILRRELKKALERASKQLQEDQEDE